MHKADRPVFVHEAVSGRRMVLRRTQPGHQRGCFQNDRKSDRSRNALLVPLIGLTSSPTPVWSVGVFRLSR
jgi:hypothetical protein